MRTLSSLDLSVLFVPIQTEDSWIREVEFKRNKLPRARKTLSKKAESTTFERRSRKDLA